MGELIIGKSHQNILTPPQYLLTIYRYMYYITSFLKCQRFVVNFCVQSLNARFVHYA